ncbi:TPA: hypothetical protein PXM77_002963 [Yersinia enterocolitica]|nr:hypothetical protein [Yersinia enterocolitica]
MWHKSLLRIPANLAPVNCSTVAVHPWAFGVGQTETSGSFLSPANAIDIGSALVAFKQQRAVLLAEAKNSLEQLQGASVPLWALSVEGNTQTAITEMKKDIPDSQAIFSLAIMFVGADLAPLRAMVVNHG